jgi:uncharacterized protein YndB with AHSA1/START domain
MTHPNDDIELDSEPKPLVLSRWFAAPRDLVFAAWSSADHLKRWFSPETFSVPDADVDFRPGGVFDLCMRSPAGQDFWQRGHFTEVAPHDRLAFTTSVAVGGAKRFTSRTTVTFEADADGTRMTVRQEYELHDSSFRFAIDGAPEGWRTTLDKLERELASLEAAPKPSVVHAIFSIERRWDAAPATVFHALSDQAAKARWFSGGDGFTILERSMDVRPGGRERLQGRWANGTVSTFDAVYFDVVPNVRLVYSYEMWLDDQKISVSLATMELLPVGTGTRLVVTEQGAFLDGYEDAGSPERGTISRERGTGLLLDRLGASLQG